MDKPGTYPSFAAVRRSAGHAVLDRRHATPARRLSCDGLRHVHGDPRHPDRLGVAGRDPGRTFGERRRNLLGADVVSHRRSRDDPAIGIPGARAFDARVCSLSAAVGFTAASALCATATIDRPDDRLPGAAGLHRRRHDPERVRGRLLALSAFEAGHRLADHRPRCDAGADDRADGRRLPERHLFSWHWLFLVNVGPGIARRDSRSFSSSISTSRIIRCLAASTSSDWQRMAVFLGSLEYVLEEGPRYDWFDDQTIATARHCRRRRRASSSSGARSTAKEPIVELQGLPQPQLRVRVRLQLHDGHRPLRPHVYLSDLSCAGTRL